MAFEFIALISGFAASVITIVTFVMTVIKHFLKKKPALSANKAGKPTKK